MAADTQHQPVPQQTFTYTPFLPHSQEIRLVRILEGGGRGIRLKLGHNRLENVLYFTAVSYRWGEPTRDRLIEVNGGLLGITESLHAFLWEARERMSPTRQAMREEFTPDDCASGWLWIDAICINQDDLVERSGQVPLMKGIYERATSLVIWLGPADHDTSVALDLLQRLAKLSSPDQWCEIRNGDTPGLTFVMGVSGSDESIETNTFQLAAAGRLLDSEYWSRAWIRQEASTPKDELQGQSAFVLCGKYTMTRAALFLASRRISQAAYENRAREHINLYHWERGQISSVKELMEVRQDRRLQQEQSLYKVLVGHRSAFATDPRDKVYANLGLMLDGQLEGSRLKVDYTLSVGTVFANVARLLIEQSGSLDCLASAALPRSSGVPSWAPDWSYRYDVVPVPFYQQKPHVLAGLLGSAASGNDHFCACGDLPMEARFDGRGKRSRSRVKRFFHPKLKPLGPSDSLSLFVTGFTFERIVAVSLPRPFPDADHHGRWRSWVETTKPDHSAYIGDGTRFQAFAKTLKADYAELANDSSGTRGSVLEGFDSPDTNAFELPDIFMQELTLLRSVVRTEKGYMGLTAGTVQPSDVVCIVFGSSMPLVLREDGERWLFVGQAYVHGIMDGEALGLVQLERVKRTFEIR